MMKQNIFSFLKKNLYSSLFLWLCLIILKQLNFKMEINITIFLWLSVFLLLAFFPRQILIYLILSLNKINIFIKMSKEPVKIESEKFQYLFPLFIRKVLKFLKGFPRLLKFIFTNYLFWLEICILGILLDIFVFKFTFDILILFLTGLWILSVFHFKFNGKISAGLALFILVLCPFLLISKKEIIAEKAANWIYIFLLISMVQMFIEEIKNKKEIKY